MNETVKKNGIQYGIILGIFSILVTAVIYSVDINLFLSGWITFLKISVFTIGMCLLLSKTKKELNGIFPFKQAFTTFFIASCIALLLPTLFEVILFNIIDPSLKETIKEMSMKFTANFMEKIGAKSSDINDAIKEIEKTDQFSIWSLVKGYIFQLMFSCVLGLILAAIFKTQSPNRD